MMPRLMFPEPDDTGSGGTEETPAQTQETPATDTPETEEPTSNPFDIAFGDADGESKSETETEEADKETADYTLGLSESDGFDADEIPMLTGLAQKHNLDAESATAFLKELNQEVVRQERENEKRSFDEGTDALRKKWGRAFDDNVKKAGRMIQTIGSRLGWSKERMNAMLNPHDIELMSEIERMYGNSKMRGLSNPAPAAPKEMTRAEIDARRTELINIHYQARRKGDMDTMKKASDEHYELSKKISGANAMRILRDK